MLRWLYSKLHPRTTADPIVSTVESRKEAHDAVEKSNADLKNALDRETVVTQVVTSLNVQLQRNHFAEMLEHTMRGTG